MAIKVLVGEDSKLIVTMMEQALKEQGYEVITAFDGEEVLAKATSELPALIILDIMMPKLDGYSVTLKLKENNKTKDIPILISSAKGQMREVFRLDERTKIVGYLEKPFTISAFVTEVNKILKK